MATVESQSQQVCPGDELASTAAASAGEGTYEEDGRIYAAVIGTASTSGSAPGKQTVHVQSTRAGAKIPQQGDTVLARVTRTQRDRAACEIACVGQHRLGSTFQGMIKREDVRASEVDKVLMQESFRPGDLIRARVLSLGTMRDYRLTTAEAELGVVFAKSLAGAPMAAESWHEMRCPETQQLEKRKVAKLVQQ